MGLLTGHSDNILTGHGGGAFVFPEVAPLARTWKMNYSPKTGYDGKLWTQKLLATDGPAGIRRDGGVYESVEFQSLGCKDAGGRMVSLPNDATIWAVNYGQILTNLQNYPSIYTDEVVVFDVGAGSLDDTTPSDNSLYLTGSVSGVPSDENTSPTAYRHERLLDTLSGWGGPLPYWGISDEGGVSNLATRLYFESDEADVNDISNNPHKAIIFKLREIWDHADCIRWMGFSLPQELTITHMKDYGQVDDVCWLGKSVFYGGEKGILACPTPTGRQGAPIEFMLDYCENGSPSAQPQECWFNTPGTLNCGMRQTTYTYRIFDKTTWDINGNPIVREAGDTLMWVDPAWFDLSSITINDITASKGEIKSYDPNSGMIVYSPVSSDPFTHTSGEQQLLITVTGNTVVYSDDGNGAGNTPSPGPQDTWTQPYRVLYDGSPGLYFLRPQTGNVWPLNRAFVSSADRFTSNARAMNDKIIASPYSSTRPLYVEFSNEFWNFSGLDFEPNCLLGRGMGTAYDTELQAWLPPRGFSLEFSSLAGPGIYAALFKHAAEVNMATRPGSPFYNIRWTLGPQTDDLNSDHLRGYMYGWMFAHEVLLGYDYNDILNNENPKLWFFGTGYTDSLFSDAYGPTNNISGLTGQAHVDWVLDRFTGGGGQFPTDSSALLAAMIAWHTTSTEKFLNNARMAKNHERHKARAEALNFHWGGMYESGDHDFYVFIHPDLRNSTVTNGDGQTFTEWYAEQKLGQYQATILEDKFQKLLAVDPEMYLCQYMGNFEKTFGEPWAVGDPDDPPTPEVLKLQEYGRLAT